MVQQEAISRIDHPDLAIYVVWEPMLRTDDERSARKATTLFDDPRVTQFWAATTEVGEAFQAPLGLTTEPAWDVYLVYAPGVRWDDATPPEPTFFMHQLGGRLPDGQRLDGAGLANRVRELLGS